jgi:co-chaperonin GroES (HSP10)
MKTLEAVFRAEHIAKVSHMKPLNDRVLVRRSQEEDDNLVKIPDAWKGKTNRGEVLALGSDVTATINIGDEVIFGPYSAQDITIDGEDLVLISFRDIWLRL